MLSVNKPLMDAAFTKLCIKGSAIVPDTGGAIYKAAYHAYYDKAADKLPKSDPSDTDFLQKMTENGTLVAQIDKQLKDEAHEFASLFADAMDEILKEVSKQIDAHCKAIDFMILEPVPNPTTGTTLATAVGPAAGAISINTVTGSTLQIM